MRKSASYTGGCAPWPPAARHAVARHHGLPSNRASYSPSAGARVRRDRRRHPAIRRRHLFSRSTTTTSRPTSRFPTSLSSARPPTTRADTPSWTSTSSGRCSAATPPRPGRSGSRASGTSTPGTPTARRTTPTRSAPRCRPCARARSATRSRGAGCCCSRPTALRGSAGGEGFAADLPDRAVSPAARARRHRHRRGGALHGRDDRALLRCATASPRTLTSRSPVVSRATSPRARPWSAPPVGVAGRHPLGAAGRRSLQPSRIFRNTRCSPGRATGPPGRAELAPESGPPPAFIADIAATRPCCATPASGRRSATRPPSACCWP